VSANTQLEQYLWENRERFYRVAYTYARSEADALDIVSEAAVKALRKRGKLRDPAAMATWCYRILVHTAIDYTRKRKRVVYMDDMEPVDRGQADRYPNLDLQEALARLPDQLRIIVILRFLEEMTIAETAAVLRQNVSTVKSRLYRALKILRIDLDEQTATTKGDTACE
jgi:RNA polymerase sigma-70 factor (ECF subfamily)